MKADLLLKSAPLCLVSGALLPLSLAPFHAWWIAPLSLALFVFLLEGRNAAQTLKLSWCYGSGLFTAGASWVYVSIHEYGYAPAPLATFLTAVFTVGLGFVFALPFWIYGKFPDTAPRKALLVFPALWVLGEWIRSWLLTGFPWLYLGYIHTDTVLAGWFPVIGVYGLSGITALAGVALHHAIRQHRYLPLLATTMLAVCGWGLQSLSWTQVHREDPLFVGIVQPNFSLHDKWNPDKREWIRSELAHLSQSLAKQDIVIWPEAALPEFYHEAQPFLQTVTAALGQHTTLVTGVLSVDFRHSHPAKPIVYNSIVALGNGDGLYHKVRLVPFGEYVPLEHWLRGLIRFFNLPTSHMSQGPHVQSLLQAGTYPFSPFICYEIVYPDLVAHNSRHANFLVTISNDSWFGDSMGPHQHLQMARARALETGRYVIRATNDGISAIINPQGIIEQSSQRFTTQTLSGTIHPAAGVTPFMVTGSTPWMLLLIGIVFGYGWVLRRTNQAPNTAA